MKPAVTLLVLLTFINQQTIFANPSNNTIYVSINNSIQGAIVDEKTGKSIANALVLVQNQGIEVYSNEDGIFKLPSLQDNTLHLIVIADGYQLKEYEVSASNTPIRIAITPNTLDLESVVVVGTKGIKNTTTSTHISRKAIEHLQATSLQDILQLVPGNLISNPNFSGANQANIRQYGADKAGSLGTAVVINGATLSNNANMQATNTATGGSGASFSSSSGGGIDLRTINADNIESVEVIRGIPSVEHGDLTSGAIIVQTKASKEPLQVKARFNPTLTQYWAGKGFQVGSKYSNLYVDIDYTKSNDKETNQYQYYTRTTANTQFTTLLGKQRAWRSNSTLSFSQARDIHNLDPDFVVDSARNSSRETTVRLSTNGTATLNKPLSRQIKYNFATSYGVQKGYQQQFYNADITAESYALTNSTNQVPYLPSSYMSRMRVDGKPLSINASISNQLLHTTGVVQHAILLGADWRYDVNLGAGKTFTRPVRNTSGAAYRERPFNAIPALNQLGIYLQDQLTAQWGEVKSNLVAGVRYDAIQPFDSKYNLQAISPRVNAAIQLPNRLTLRGGYGITAKAPTLLYLYPENAYFDFYSLNYYASHPAERLALISTRVYDSQNTSLRLSKNYKSEVGFDYTWGDTQRKRISMTAYHERMPNSYSFSTTLSSVKFAQFPLYQVVSKPSEQPPVIDENPEEKTRFVSYTMPNNATTRINRGVELEMDLGRFKPINTTFNITGAYTSTRSTNNNYYILQQDIAGRETTRIGVFNKGRGNVNDRLVSTIRAIHHIPELRFLVTLSAQTIWLDKSRNLGYQSVPVGYISIEQQDQHNPAITYLTEEERATITRATDPDLFLTINEASFLTESWKPLWLFNVKLTKEFKTGLSFSFFANNFVNYRPLQSSTRYPTIYYKRNIDLFFGTEISIKF